MPSSRAVARIESPCREGLGIDFERDACLAVGERRTVGAAALTIVPLVVAGCACGRGGPPLKFNGPRPEATRSSAGSSASSERRSRSTPERGGAWPTEAMVSPWCPDRGFAAGALQHLDRARRR